jgi:hypothetical protein
MATGDALIDAHQERLFEPEATSTLARIAYCRLHLQKSRATKGF